MTRKSPHHHGPYFTTRETPLEALENIFASRLTPAAEAAEATVRAILNDVRRRGDDAVLEYTRRWDCPQADRLRVPEAEIAAAA